MRKFAVLLLLLTAGFAMAGLNIGDKAPEFKLPDIRTDKEVSLSDYRGQVVLMQIWKTN